MKLTNEVLEIEKKLMNSYKQEKTHEEVKAVGAIKKNSKFFYKFAKKYSKRKNEPAQSGW